MELIYPDLWQSISGSHFGLSLRTYLLQTERGKVLFYYTDVQEETNHILKIGPLQYQFISHHHEIMPALYENIDQFKSTVGLHKHAMPYLVRPVNDLLIFNNSQTHETNIEIIYTPGHTDNNLCFYYQSPHGKSYLFTGDTIYLDRGKWNYLILPHEGGSKETLIESLLALRSLRVDVILCSVAVGVNEAVEVNQMEWEALINDLLGKLEQ